MTQVPEPKMYFSKEQYEYLNKVFCEVIPQASNTLNEVMMQAGKRYVVDHVKSRMK